MKIEIEIKLNLNEEEFFSTSAYPVTAKLIDQGKEDITNEQKKMLVIDRIQKMTEHLYQKGLTQKLTDEATKQAKDKMQQLKNGQS